MNHPVFKFLIAIELFFLAQTFAEEKLILNADVKPTVTETQTVAAAEVKPAAATQIAPAVTTQSQTVVVVETTQGTFEVKLRPDLSPKTCENFIGLVKNKYYDDTIFHRVIKGFMIQGGDPTGSGAGGQSIWGKKFSDEFASSLKFDHKGLLAMANSGPNTNGSQFFITTASAPWLNQKHTIFGEIVTGYDVVQAIESTKTGPSDRPVTPQKIIKAYLKT